MPSPKIEPKQDIITMNFYEALKQVFVNKRRVSRLSWNSNEEYGFLGEDGRLRIHTNGAFHQWIVNDGDALGEDWFILPEQVEELKN